MPKCAYCKQEKGKLSIKSVDVCTSCNAHGRDFDTLKAKAELFDEAIEALETAIVTNPNFYDPSDAWELINKAKEL